MTQRNSFKSRWIAFLSICMAPLLLTGCNISFQDGIRGSGISKSESREVVEFDQIELDGFGTVNVEFGETPSLNVTCDDNLLEYVQAKVTDGVLVLSLRESIDPVTPLTFDLVTNNLKAVEIDGAGKLNINSAKLDDLRLVVDGAGEIHANGTVNNLDISISGAAKVDANELHAKTIKIGISGAGKANIYASESLDASISGAGVVNCLGKPKVTQSVSGAGSINLTE